jgi:hypothetical protein
MSPRNVSFTPAWSTSTPVTVVPASSVVRRIARAFVSSVTFRWPRAGRTPKISASDLPITSEGNPSQVWHRMQMLFGMSSASSRMPHGAWNGW